MNLYTSPGPNKGWPLLSILLLILCFPRLGSGTQMENGRTGELPGQDGVMLAYLPSVWDMRMSGG